MKVGDYVRTKCGIAKIIGTEAQDLVINLDKAIMIYHPEYIASCTHDEIIKSSPNIIDLIEVGDIVNHGDIMGGLVLDKRDDEITVLTILPNKLKNKDIKSVITREQIENNLYKLEE